MKQNKQIIAITGLIGSGKSTVCAILRKKGEITLNCDEINAELLTEKKYIDGLQKLFPQAFVEGLLHKNVLRKIVFSSDNERLKLNEYSHKEIKKRLEEKIKEISAQKIFVEVPLLTDQMFISLFDTIWIVKAEENEQLQRIIPYSVRHTSLRTISSR